jgi:purine-binding chemotaxis protein CheW
MHTPKDRCILKKSSEACERLMSEQINWDEIWESFAWNDTADAEDAIAKRLQQRARQYAAPTRRLDVAAEDARTVLTFGLADERYGVDVMVVRGVRTINRVVRVPGTQPFYRGVVNVRGQVITVMDLRLFFDIPVRDDLNAPDELVVVQAAGLEIGLLAHDVEGVAMIPTSEFEPVDNMRYAFGVTKNQLTLLDIQRLLEDDQLIVGGKEES